jgi:DNA-directed RNA polymerase specialized sigma24 family protein
MPEEIPTPSLVPPQPLPPQADVFAAKVHQLLDGQPKDEQTVNAAFEGMEGIFDHIAAGLYSLASMLVGEGEDSIELVEAAVAGADIDACTDAEQARHSSRRALAAAAVDLLAQRDSASLAAPLNLEHAVTCIEDDDLDAASGAESGRELERMISGPDRERVRNWLEGLPTDLRTIYVLRAVAGLSSAETASLLADHGGPLAAGWSPDAVRELFRQGLCSLASQLIHSTTGR